MASTAPRDALGRISRKTELIDGVTRVFTYGYDNRNRLRDVFVDGLPSEHYEYDANGNRVSATTSVGTVTAAYDDQDRLLAHGDFEFAYSANGELEAKTNVVTGDTWLFEYDALGNLLTATLPSGTLIEYLVDGLGRRVAKRVNGTVVKQWIYRDQLRPAAELDGAGNLVAQFAYSPGGTTPELMLRAGVRYRILADHLGSPRLIVNASSGQVAQRLRHDAWGNVLEDTSPGFVPFGFAGGLYDPDTGLVRFGARDYDPLVGRWTSKEPLRFRAGRNFYIYGFDDPINLRDPNGLEPLPAGCGGAGNGDGGSEGAPSMSPMCGTPWFQDWCGDAANQWVPDKDILGTADYSVACETHDECYATCGEDKFDCDWNLGHDMQMMCALRGDRCEISGFAFFLGVVYGGQHAYDRAQANCVCE
jgi:RHS repeat-associated protein